MGCRILGGTATVRLSGLGAATVLSLAGLVNSCSSASNSEVETPAENGAEASSSGGESMSDSFSVNGTASYPSQGSMTSRAGGVASGGRQGTYEMSASLNSGGKTSAVTLTSGGASRTGSTDEGATTSGPSRGGRNPINSSAPDSSTSGNGCPALGNWTEAVRFVLKASWAATSAILAGSADIEVLTLVKLSADNNNLLGSTRGCRTALPPTQLSAAGQIVTGGTMMLTDIPDAVWDAPSIGTTDCAGTQSATGISSSIEYGFAAQIGVTLKDPAGAWPASGSGLITDDVDGDGNPGFTSIPKSGDGYVLPPTGLGILGSAPTADKVYVVNRNIVALSGTRTSCDEHSGKATFSAFDNHVVGCHTKNGNCSASQVDFCDQNRPIYKISSVTYTARRVSDAATCADVRALFSSPKSSP